VGSNLSRAVFVFWPRRGRELLAGSIRLRRRRPSVCRVVSAESPGDDRSSCRTRLCCRSALGGPGFVGGIVPGASLPEADKPSVDPRPKAGDPFGAQPQTGCEHLNGDCDDLSYTFGALGGLALPDALGVAPVTHSPAPFQPRSTVVVVPRCAVGPVRRALRPVARRGPGNSGAPRQSQKAYSHAASARTMNCHVCEASCASPACSRRWPKESGST